ncbi:GAF and ANTAR domain-containing protein [Cryptosporangium arvum]|uniref:GAF and ANTAR domain-containing protein n=1 Tax=Cryptosporangium arvum TaxID=80871 RepID=UPI0004B4CECF|nr:GAF and ANTAR domain-containing protein [Cryptosporangium arvum]
MTTVSAERLASVFVEVADTLVEQFDLLEFLHMLTDRTADLVSAAAVGIVLADKDGRLEFMAGSDENVKLLELFQLQTQEGPCQEAYRLGKPVVNVDLSQATPRWPRFAPQAAALGFRSVHAFPLRLRNHTIGALNVFGGALGGHFDANDVPVVQALADVAAISLLQERAIHRGEVLTEQLQGALNTRIVIEQAKGAIAQIHQISVDEAFIRLRAYARNNSKRLTDVAHAVIADPSSVPGLI